LQIKNKLNILLRSDFQDCMPLFCKVIRRQWISVSG